MRPSIVFVSLLTLLGALPARPSPVLYTIIFMSNDSTPQPVGQFNYDQSIPNSFSNFIVYYNGSNFIDETAAANAPSILGNPTCANGLSGAAASFYLLTNCPTAGYRLTDSDLNQSFLFFDTTGPSGSNISIFATLNIPNPFTHIVSTGTFSVAPEPATSALMLIGLFIGSGLLVRRRIASSFGRLR